MRLTCTLVLGALLSQAVAQEPAKAKVLDWSLVPVGGDKDYLEQRKKLEAEYVGKDLIAEGWAGTVVGGNAREITITLHQPVRRGELTLTRRIQVTFHDMKQAPIEEVVRRRLKVRVSGRAEYGTLEVPLRLDQARFVPVAKKR